LIFLTFLGSRWAALADGKPNRPDALSPANGGPIFTPCSPPFPL